MTISPEVEIEPLDAQSINRKANQLNTVRFFDCFSTFLAIFRFCLVKFLDIFCRFLNIFLSIFLSKFFVDFQKFFCRFLEFFCRFLQFFVDFYNFFCRFLQFLCRFLQFLHFFLSVFTIFCRFLHLFVDFSIFFQFLEFYGNFFCRFLDLFCLFFVIFKRTFQQVMEALQATHYTLGANSNGPPRGWLNYRTRGLPFSQWQRIFFFIQDCHLMRQTREEINANLFLDFNNCTVEVRLYGKNTVHPPSV